MITPVARGVATYHEPMNRSTGLLHLLASVGPSVLRLVAGAPNDWDPVDGVAVLDLTDDQPAPPHTIVLGVGLDPSAEAILPVLAELSRCGAPALIVRGPVPADDRLHDVARDTGVVVLALTEGTSWNQLVPQIRTIPAVEHGDEPDEPDLAEGDLFSIADSICALIDAPVTIEDLGNRVLAYSDRQHEADRARIETILSRQVPRFFADLDDERGVTRRLLRSTRPVFLDRIDLGAEANLARVAVAVRAGDEVLGSIWAAVSEPLSPERENLLLEASRLVAVHLTQLRARADGHQTFVTNMVTTALDGGPTGRAALKRLGADRHPCLVLAMASMRDRSDDVLMDAAAFARQANDHRRAARALSLHLGAGYPGAAVAVHRDVTYAIVPVSAGEDAPHRVAESCRGFLNQYQNLPPALIGISQPAPAGADLVSARSDADRALMVLRHSATEPAVTLAGDVEVDALLLELRGLAAAAGRGPSGAYARLLEYDRTKGPIMLPTLRAWLDAHGDVITAARTACVHQNTFRYRLKRISEVGRVDLDDPRARLGLSLQMEIYGTTETTSW